MRLAVTGCFYFNADYRIFDFAAAPTPHREGKEDVAEDGLGLGLVQHSSTKENGGGLGWSWTDEVVLGSDLPEELPST